MNKIINFFFDKEEKSILLWRYKILFLIYSLGGLIILLNMLIGK